MARRCEGTLDEAGGHQQTYANASIVGENRVVSNIKGNRYRLVVAINYPYGVCCVRFVGTHAAYDRIDAATIRESVMQIRPIKTKADHREALRAIEKLRGARPDTPDGDRLDVLTTLVERYEEQADAIELPDPIDALRYHMESRGVTRRDLEALIGSRARVAEVLNRRRALMIDMI